MSIVNFNGKVLWVEGDNAYSIEDLKIRYENAIELEATLSRDIASLEEQISSAKEKISQLVAQRAQVEGTISECKIILDKIENPSPQNQDTTDIVDESEKVEVSSPVVEVDSKKIPNKFLKPRKIIL